MNYKDLFGILFIITSFFDAIKYVWQAQSIKKVGTAKGQSRKFINAAIFNDLIKLCYAIIIKDLFIFFSACIALITMIYCWHTIYMFYPYKYRNLMNFKRPNIVVYTINSLLPNSLRRKL